MSHQFKTATIVPAAKGIGESDFAAARTALRAKYGVAPAEVFLDTVQTEGVVDAGDFSLDLGELGLRYLGFGADAPASAPLSAPADADALVVPPGTTTTTI